MAGSGGIKTPSPMAGWVALVCVLMLLGELRGVMSSSFCQTVIQPLQAYACTEFTVQTDDGFVLVLHRLSKTANNWPTRSRHAINHHTRNHHGGTEADKNVTGKTAVQQAPPLPSASSSAATPGRAPSLSKYHFPRGRSLFRTSKIGQKTHFHKRNSSTTRPEEIASRLPTSLLSSKSPSFKKLPNDDNVASNPTKNRTAESVPLPDTPISGSPQSASPSNDTSQPVAGKGAPVLLMHQEMLNGDSWFQFVDEQHLSRLLPDMLLDDGFDVWIGHQRATYWGHDHVSLQYTNRAFWNWTWDEHAQYDLPAQLRFIVAETNQTVNYIGASQAATVGAAGATNNETANMLRSLTLIGPTVYRGNSNSLLLDAWAYYFGFTLDMEYYATGFQNGAFNFTREFPRTGPITGDGASGLEIGLISGPNCCLGSAAIQLDNGWDGTTSFKNLLHWQQGIRRNTFAHYSYNDAQGNRAAYGQNTAPLYDPAKIPRNLPIFVIAGGRDWTAPPRGTIMFLSALQAPAQVLNLTNYAHYDLTFSRTRDIDLFEPILDFLGGALFQ